VGATFGSIETAIGDGDELFRPSTGAAAQGGHTDAEADVDRAARVGELHVANLAHALGQLAGGFEIGSAHDDGELLAAVARKDVFGAQRLADASDHFHQHGVTRLMPVVVVH
jgi:hypothetical protein